MYKSEKATERLTCSSKNHVVFNIFIYENWHNALNYNTKPILNWFESMSFRFGIKANFPGVGAGQDLRGKLDVCAGSRGTLN